MSWNPDHDEKLLRLRHDDRLDFGSIALVIRKSRGAVIGRYYRLIGHGFPSDRRYRVKGQIKAPKLVAERDRSTEIRPAKYPYAPDCSSYDFAWDDDHCGAVIAHGGFPVLERRAA